MTRQNVWIVVGWALCVLGLCGIVYYARTNPADMPAWRVRIFGFAIETGLADLGGPINSVCWSLFLGLFSSQYASWLIGGKWKPDRPAMVLLGVSSTGIVLSILGNLAGIVVRDIFAYAHQSVALSLTLVSLVQLIPRRFVGTFLLYQFQRLGLAQMGQRRQTTPAATATTIGSRREQYIWAWVLFIASAILTLAVGGSALFWEGSLHLPEIIIGGEFVLLNLCTRTIVSIYTTWEGYRRRLGITRQQFFRTPAYRNECGGLIIRQQWVVLLQAITAVVTASLATSLGSGDLAFLQAASILLDGVQEGVANAVGLISIYVDQYPTVKRDVETAASLIRSLDRAGLLHTILTDPQLPTPWRGFPHPNPGVAEQKELIALSNIIAIRGGNEFLMWRNPKLRGYLVEVANQRAAAAPPHSP